MVEEWIGQREFGRRRNVTHRAVQVAINSKRIPETSVRRNEKGRVVAVEWHSANAAWNANTDPDQAARAGAPVCVGTGELPLIEKQQAAIGGDVDTPANGGDDALYLAARRRKMEFDAKQSELDYLQALGRLISTEELRGIIARRYSGIRDKFQNIGAQEAPILAAKLGIPEKTHLLCTLLDEIHKRRLNELSDDAVSEVARGVAERVAA